MSRKVRLSDLFEGTRYQKVVLTVSILAFLLLELLIYLVCASEAGQKSRVIVTKDGVTIYETLGSTLSAYEVTTFERNYGPLKDYQVQVVTETKPFPFRAWVSSAVGIPVALVLLVAFVVRVFMALLYGEDSEGSGDPSAGGGESKHRFGSLMHLFKGISVFHVGFLLVISVLLLWMVPNFIGDFLTVSMAAIRDYKWFFLGLSVFLAVVLTWIIYLRYKLSKQMLDNQLDLEKYRFERQLLLERETTRQLLPDPPLRGTEDNS